MEWEKWKAERTAVENRGTTIILSPLWGKNMKLADFFAAVCNLFPPCLLFLGPLFFAGLYAR
jgi:hypothetical protein